MSHLTFIISFTSCHFGDFWSFSSGYASKAFWSLVLPPSDRPLFFTCLISGSFEEDEFLRTCFRQTKVKHKILNILI